MSKLAISDIVQALLDGTIFKLSETDGDGGMDGLSTRLKVSII